MGEGRGGEGKDWLKDLRTWWRKGGRSMKMPADGVSGATRAPGQYTIPLPADLKPGQYVLNVEAARETGGREIVTVPLKVPAAPARAVRLGIETRHLSELDAHVGKDAGATTVRLVRDADRELTQRLDGVRVQEGADQESLAEADDALAAACSILRLTKDAWEVGQMQRAVDATKVGFEAVIADLPEAVRRGRGERWVEGVFGLHARHEGNGVGYDSICAAGDHANTLHWIKNTGELREGDLLLLDAGPLARLGQDPVERRACRAEGHGREPPDERGRDDAARERSPRSRAGRHHLAVPEAAAVGEAGEGVRPAHDPRVERRHDERRGPAVHLGRAPDGQRSGDPGHAAERALGRGPGAGRVGPRRLGGTVGTVAVGVGDEPACRSILRGLDRLLAHRVDRAAAQSAGEATDVQGRLAELALAGLPDGPCEEVDPEVGGDRVEAARVDDPRPAPARRVRPRVRAPPREEDLAREIAVVRPRLGARAHERLAVALVGPHRRDDDPGAASELAQGGEVLGVCDENCRGFDLIIRGPRRRNHAR